MFEKVKNILRKLLFPGVAVVVVVVGILLISMGWKEIDIGGILAKLWQKPIKKNLENTTPPERVDEKGEEIPVGVPDDKGVVQAKVQELEKPGILDDAKEDITLVSSRGDTINIPLPTGVSTKTVDKVIAVKTTNYKSRVKRKPGPKKTQVDKLLKKMK